MSSVILSVIDGFVIVRLLYIPNLVSVALVVHELQRSKEVSLPGFEPQPADLKPTVLPLFH